MTATRTCLTALLALTLTLEVHCQETALDGTTLPRIKLESPDNHGGLNLFLFSPDGSVLAGASGVGTMTMNGKSSTFGGDVLLWDPVSGSIARTLGAHDTTPKMLAFTADGTRLLSYSREDHVARMWNVGDGTLVTELKLSGPGSSKQPPVMSPDGRFLIHLAERHLDIGTGDGLDASYLLEAWDIQEKKQLWKETIEDPDGQLDARFAVSPDGRSVAISARSIAWKEDGESLSGRHLGKYHALLDIRTGKPVWRIDVDRTTRGRQSEELVLFTPDGSEILMAGWDKIQRYATTDGSPIGEPIDLEDEDSINQVHFNKDGSQFLVVRFFDRQIDVHAFPSGKEIFRAGFAFPAALHDGSSSPDLKRIAGQLQFDPVIIDLSSAYGQ